MKLRGGRFLSDENIHADVVAFLRFEGCDILDVKEQELDGSDDLFLIRLSVAESRVVLTHDSDFGALAMAAQEPIFGILYLRPGHILPEFTVGTVRALFDQEADLEPPFILENILLSPREAAVKSKSGSVH